MGVSWAIYFIKYHTFIPKRCIFKARQYISAAEPFIDLSDFKRENEVVDHIYLSEKEILHIWNLDLSKREDLIPVRDVLVFGCYTGLRYSDIYSLMSYHIKKIVVGNEIQIAIHAMLIKVI